MHPWCTIFLSHCIALFSHNNMLLFTVEHTDDNQEFGSLISKMMNVRLSLKSAILIYHQEIALTLALSLMLILAPCLKRSLVHCGMYHALPPHPTVHEDGQQNQYAKSQAFSFKSAVAIKQSIVSRTPVLSLISVSAPFLTRHSTVQSWALLAARCRGVC